MSKGEKMVFVPSGNVAQAASKAATLEEQAGIIEDFGHDGGEFVEPGKLTEGDKTMIAQMNAGLVKD